MVPSHVKKLQRASSQEVIDEKQRMNKLKHLGGSFRQAEPSVYTSGTTSFIDKSEYASIGPPVTRKKTDDRVLMKCSTDLLEEQNHLNFDQRKDSIAALDGRLKNDGSISNMRNSMELDNNFLPDVASMTPVQI